MTNPPPTPNPAKAPPNKWVILTIVTVGFFMILLDTTVINVALPTLRLEFNSTLDQAQWIISVYVLAMGIVMPVTGYLSGKFGARRIYLLGLGTFALGSLLCGLSPNLTLFILFRILQGIGGGLVAPLGIALLLQSFPVREHGEALGYYGISALVAPALGPILGGALVGLGLWRVIFFINPPIALASILLSARYLRHDRHVVARWFDLAGILAEIVGFGSILMGATLAAGKGWLAPQTLFWLGLGVAGLLVFVLIELRFAGEPILDLRLFGNRIFLNASLLGYVTVLALFGAEFLLPNYLQTLRGLTPLHTGLVLLPMAVTSGILVILSGRIYDRIGPRMLMIVGFSMLAINTWQLSQLQADTALTWIMFLLVLRGMALGLTVQTTMATAMSVIPHHDLPRGTSLSNSTRQVAQSLAVAVLATVLVGNLSPQVKALENTMNSGSITDGHTQAICSPTVVSPAPALTTGSNTNVPGSELFDQACQEYLAGFDRTYKLTFYASLAALLLGALLPGWPFKWVGRHGMAEFSQ